MIVKYLFTTFGVSLVLTELIELTVAYLLGIRTRKSFKTLFIANIITNPLVVLIAMVVKINNFGNIRTIYTVMEFMVVIVEGYIYSKNVGDCKHPYYLSLILNTISYLLGYLL